MNRNTYQLLEKLCIIKSYQVTKEEYDRTPEGLKATSNAKAFGYEIYKEMDETEQIDEIKLELMARQTLLLQTIKNTLIFIAFGLLGAIILLIN